MIAAFNSYPLLTDPGAIVMLALGLGLTVLARLSRRPAR